MTPVVEAKCQLTGLIVILAPFSPERTTSSSVERTDSMDERPFPPSLPTKTAPIRRRNGPTTRWCERTPPATNTIGSGDIRPIANESRKLA
jgi:hypothetical protein